MMTKDEVTSTIVGLFECITTPGGLSTTTQIVAQLDAWLTASDEGPTWFREACRVFDVECQCCQELCETKAHLLIDSCMSHYAGTSGNVEPVMPAPEMLQ